MMTLKRILSIYTSLAFSVIFGLSAFAIYIFFASYRREEFKERLQEKAQTTAKLLLEVRKEDRQVLKLIDKKTINSLYNEKTLVFDSSYSLIYSSIDDASIDWNINDLKRLKQMEMFYSVQDEKDVVGVFYPIGNKDFYILIAAEDKYGNRRLHDLLITLISTYLVAVITVWLLSYQMIQRLLNPLDTFQRKISSFPVNDLNTRLPETDDKNEINQLTKSFNQLLARVDRAFEMQKEFTSHASHELRTPISRMTLRIDNLLRESGLSENTKSYLNDVNADLNLMSDLISSLLLLARYNEENWNEKLERIRIDELVFSAYDKVRQQYPTFQMNFEVMANDEDDYALEVRAQKATLEIAFVNLLRNACLYASDLKVTVRIGQTGANKLSVEIINKGEPIGDAESSKLFQPFTRGQNSKNVSGSGLGLRIAKRILDYHQATINYTYLNEQEHCFKLVFLL